MEYTRKIKIIHSTYPQTPLNTILIILSELNCYNTKTRKGCRFLKTITSYTPMIIDVFLCLYMRDEFREIIFPKLNGYMLNNRTLGYDGFCYTNSF